MRQRPVRLLMVSDMNPISEDSGYGIYVNDLVEKLRALGVTVELLVANMLRDDIRVPERRGE